MMELRKATTFVSSNALTNPVAQGRRCQEEEETAPRNRSPPHPHGTPSISQTRMLRICQPWDIIVASSRRKGG